MRQVEARVPPDRDDADVRLRDPREQLVHGDPPTAEPDQILDTELLREGFDGFATRPVAVDAKEEAGDAVAEPRDGAHDQVEAVHVVDGSVEDEHEVPAIPLHRGIPPRVEPLIIEGVEDDPDLLFARSALREPLAHLLSAGDGRVGESNAHLLAETERADQRVLRWQLVLQREEFGHAFVEVQKDASAEQPWHERRED